MNFSQPKIPQFFSGRFTENLEAKKPSKKLRLNSDPNLLKNSFIGVYLWFAQIITVIT